MLGCSGDKINFWLNGADKDLALNIDEQRNNAVLNKYGIALNAGKALAINSIITKTAIIFAFIFLPPLSYSNETHDI